ncbi:unnamed protein product, partial [Heligmosomoides polygyrus]
MRTRFTPLFRSLKSVQRKTNCNSGFRSHGSTFYQNSIAKAHLELLSFPCTVTGCEPISWRSMWTANTAELRCLFRSSLIPITVFTYMLIASIMLVNLLTALLSYNSSIFRYEAKLWLPPPLSLLYYFLHIFVFLLRVLSCLGCMLCTCTSKCTVEKNPFPYIPI